MHRSSFCVGLLADGADRISLAVVTLIGRHVLDAAVPVFTVVPDNKAIHPGFHREQIPKPPEG